MLVVLALVCLVIAQARSHMLSPCSKGFEVIRFEDTYDAVDVRRQATTSYLCASFDILAVPSESAATGNATTVSLAD